MLQKYSLVQIVFSVFVAVLVLTPFAGLSAQETAGLEVTPAVLEKVVDPGSVVFHDLRLKGIGAEELTYTFFIREITDVSASGTPVFDFSDNPPELTGDELASWIRVNDGNDRVTVKANEEIRVPIQIIVPLDAAPGTHHAMLITRLVDEAAGEAGPSGGTGAVLGSLYEVGTTMNIRVKGDVEEGLISDKFRAGKKFYGNSDEIIFESHIQNTGNVLNRPVGFITVTDFFGKELAELEFNHKRAGIMGGKERVLLTPWEPNGSLFGPYTAEMVFTYGEISKYTVVDTARFWVLPLRIFLPVVIALVVVFGGGYLWVRSMMRNQLRRAGMSEADLKKNKKPASKTGKIIKGSFLAIIIFAIVLVILL